MSKRFLKYETEAENTMVDENGVLTGNGGGSELIFLYRKRNEDSGKFEVFWDAECIQKLTAADVIAMEYKFHSIIINDETNTYDKYRIACTGISHNPGTATMYMDTLSSDERCYYHVYK